MWALGEPSHVGHKVCIVNKNTMASLRGVHLFRAFSIALTVIGRLMAFFVLVRVGAGSTWVLWAVAGTAWAAGAAPPAPVSRSAPWVWGPGDPPAWTLQA